MVTTAILAGTMVCAAARQPDARAAWFSRSLQNPVERDESRPDVLDAPVLPGSLLKTVTLVAALESHIIEAGTARLCRRVVTVDGRRYTCSHPDLKRPLTPAEALAHSCNDFFVSLAPRLPRAMLNDVRARVGLPALGTSTNYAAALVGLDGPRVSPRVLLDMIVRLIGRDRERPLTLTGSTRAVLLEGLRGAAAYGSASELGARRVSALAKTGTAPMAGGGAVGMVVVLTPADSPTQALLVVAPGAAGRDATSIAVDLLMPPRGQPPEQAPRKRADAASARPPADPPALRPLPLADATIRVGFTTPGGRTLIEPLPLEDYVARVLAGEGQPRARDAAQHALAIAIRTFALANRNRHRREGFDMCDTTHCQVLRPATAATRRAAEVTAGRVLTQDDRPATIFYSAWCGGRSELPSRVWTGATDYAFEPAQVDDACQEEPGWSSELDVRQIERALRAAGLRGERLRTLRVLARSPSGRVARLRAEGFAPDELSGDEFRLAVGRIAGWQLIKSTMFEVRRISNGYAFTGRGFGHGVGLCVVGAGARAARGETAAGILGFYYPGLSIQHYSASVVTRRDPAAAGSGTTAAARPAPATDILVALPAGEEAERSAVMRIVRGARDDIAAKTGVKAPASIRITVHPNVESFGRATGQPWWVSGATHEGAIDLLPVTILQQRGQFERTLHHEVAHVLLDAALAQRPMWVREGAALYFSNPTAATELRGRLRCPDDEELLRPISAGAHRDAYARAEACFRRGIAEGKSWRDVR